MVADDEKNELVNVFNVELNRLVVDTVAIQVDDVHDRAEDEDLYLKSRILLQAKCDCNKN